MLDRSERRNAGVDGAWNFVGLGCMLDERWVTARLSGQEPAR